MAEIKVTPSELRAKADILEGLNRQFRQEVEKMVGYESDLAGMWEGEIKGREIGRAEGRAEGIEEGRLEERIAIARNLAAAGMDPETIASITGLPVNKLTNLI